MVSISAAVFAVTQPHREVIFWAGSDVEDGWFDRQYDLAMARLNSKEKAEEYVDRLYASGPRGASSDDRFHQVCDDLNVPRHLFVDRIGAFRDTSQLRLPLGRVPDVDLWHPLFETCNYRMTPSLTRMLPSYASPIPIAVWDLSKLSDADLSHMIDVFSERWVMTSITGTTASPPAATAVLQQPA